MGRNCTTDDEIDFMTKATKNELDRVASAMNAALKLPEKLVEPRSEA